MSCRIQDLKDSTMKELCDKNNIPLLAWTINNEDLQYQAIEYGCDNVIIEGKKTYID